IDDREYRKQHESHLGKRLKELGATTICGRLAVGDYLILGSYGEKLLFERKGLRDLTKSIRKGSRILEQIRRLHFLTSRGYQSFLVIETANNAHGTKLPVVGNFSTRCVQIDLGVSIRESANVHVILSESKRDTADMLYAWADDLQTDE